MPAKKKGKKSGKLSKMTEEERVIYEEQKRLAEEEMKKKKEDMLTQFLKVIYNIHIPCVTEMRKMQGQTRDPTPDFLSCR